MNRKSKKKKSSSTQKSKTTDSIDEAAAPRRIEFKTSGSSGDLSTWEWHEPEDTAFERPPELEVKLSRTSMLLLDYRQFKAARTIQTAMRGWYVRRILAKKRAAAEIIQREWRSFYAYRTYYRLLESTLQNRIEQHYFKAAQKIQAMWRGWWVRENIHDQYRLTRMQVSAAEDLLHCVAFKLHHLLRTHQIPGIYSLRNTHCLSRVEQLLATLTFKQHNDRVRNARKKRMEQISDAKQKFEKSAFSTEVPFPGPNFFGVCEPKCCELYNEVDADRKMNKILSLYDRAARLDPRLQRIRAHPKSKLSAKKKKRTKVPPTDFCSDVINSMRRWNILNAYNIDPNIFKRPENVENFLTEIQSLYSLMQDNCYCNVIVKGDTVNV